MLSFRSTIIGATMVSIVAVLGLWAYQSAVAETSNGQSGKRIDLELSEDFYRALKAESGKSYTTDKSTQYLRQIAISSRYMVESNLHIIKQQEQIIHLLEKIQHQQQKR